MPKKPSEVRQMVKDAGVKIVDLRFVDLPASGSISRYLRKASRMSCSKTASALTAPAFVDSK